MASILKVDSMQGVTSAGDITITSEGGAATMQLQQGVAKAWANVDGTGTVAIDDSFNSASLTDRGTGQYTITYTNSMNNSVYACPFGGKNPSVASNLGCLGIAEGSDQLATGSIPFRVLFGNGSFGDYNELTLTIIGDLA